MGVLFMPDSSQKNTDRAHYLLAFRIMGDFGASIAVPVVVLVLLGQWLDAKYQTQPWLMIVGFILAAASSAKIIYTKSKKYGQEYQQMTKK